MTEITLDKELKTNIHGREVLIKKYETPFGILVGFDYTGREFPRQNRKVVLGIYENGKVNEDGSRTLKLKPLTKKEKFLTGGIGRTLDGALIDFLDL